MPHTEVIFFKHYQLNIIVFSVASRTHLLADLQLFSLEYLLIQLILLQQLPENLYNHTVHNESLLLV